MKIKQITQELYGKGKKISNKAQRKQYKALRNTRKFGGKRTLFANEG